jgi:hypothetical protein
MDYMMKMENSIRSPEEIAYREDLVIRLKKDLVDHKRMWNRIRIDDEYHFKFTPAPLYPMTEVKRYGL